jgi:hypothetical protein
MTNEKIREACDALLSGRTFHTTTSRNYTVETRSFRMFVDGTPVAKVQNNALFITVLGVRNSTTVALLNGLPNVNITGHGDYQLNGRDWDGNWYRVVDDLYKTSEDL